MVELKLTIKHPIGLHARPAVLFVQTAQQFDADIQVVCGERKGNAKSLLGVLGLGAGQGSELVISADGNDADDALNALGKLVENNFGED